MSPTAGGAARDLRMLGLGAVAWGGTVLSLVGPGWAAAGVLLVPVVALVVPRGRRPVLLACWLVLTATFAVTWFEVRATRDSAVRALAEDRASVRAEVVVRTDGVLRRGRYATQLRFDGTLVAVQARGRRHLPDQSVAVVLDGIRRAPALGSRVRISGRLAPSHDRRAVALLIGRGPPETVAGPGAVARAVTRVRGAVRDASADLGAGAAALIPALVDGDEGAAGGTASFAPEFRVAGMTHLLAVSGTNLTILLVCLLVLARWAGVRAHALIGVALVGVAGFVLLAGPEPSVLRAAAMGVVGIIGLGRAGPGRGLRALGTAVLVLVLIDPLLAMSIGFTLSVVATAGILLLAPPVRDSLARWTPRWAAEAVAVPLAAQLACTPVVAAFSGQVSLVAVAANIVAAPLVAPATVCGLAGGLVALVSVPLGRLFATPAGWCAHGLIAVANQAAGLPVAAFSWGTSVAAIATLVLLCAALAIGLPRLLARRGPSLLLALALTVSLLVPVPTPGWPPHGWVMVACDVGQGDALVLRAGNRSAVVVDAGPDPALVRSCLRRLRVRVVPVVVLTHFHADHVDGLPGVLAGRRVGRIDVSPFPEPAGAHRDVLAAARRDSIPVRVIEAGEETVVGALRWRVLGPVRLHPESDSPPNDASVVMLVTVRGVRILMLGDEETASQADLRRSWPASDLRADVLKVAHHGSARQDADLVRGTGARLAVVSAGRDNDYGHPAAVTLDLLTAAGMRVLRTDSLGDVAIVVDDDGRLASTRRGNPKGGRRSGGGA